MKKTALTMYKGLPLDDFSNIAIGIQRILVATDGSDAAITATEYAIAMAKALDASLKAIFVDAEDYDLIYPDGPPDINLFNPYTPSTAGLKVAQLLASKNNVECDTEVIMTNNVVQAIVEAAEAYSADLIIVGHKERSGLKRFTEKSVAEAVVRNSHVPTLILRSDRSGFF